MNAQASSSRPNVDPQRLIAEGCSVFPLTGKQPDFVLLPHDADDKPTWKPFTVSRPDDAQIAHWMQAKNHLGNST